MAKYGTEINKATPSLTVGLGSLAAGATPRRLKLYDVLIGSDSATLGTSNNRYEFNRSTTAATGTSVTPNPLDPADASSLSNVLSNLSVQGTNTAGVIPLSFALNQQASFRWVAQPGSEIVTPATSNNGLHINTPVASLTTSIAVHILFEEQ